MLSELVRVIGSRWPIEECFEAAKQEAGLAQYQFRLYHAWYRHITMAILAMTFLAVLRATSKKGIHHPVDNRPALTAQTRPISPNTPIPPAPRPGVQSTA